MSNLELIGTIAPAAIHSYALIGNETQLTSTDSEKATGTIIFRGEVLVVPLKYIKKLGARIYLSQVFLEARKGRDPSHLFSKKPQTDRER